MKFLRKYTALIFFLAPWLNQCRPPPESQISKHLEYSGFTRPTFSSYKKESHYIETKDGVRIAVDTFVPDDPLDGASDLEQRFPTILVITPYGRSILMQDLSLMEKLGAYWKYGTTGPVFDASVNLEVHHFLTHGYAVVYASMRGTGASTGRQIPFEPRLIGDAEETIRWLRKRSWSNGKLCMMGRSYRAWIQLMVATRKPAGLRCIIPEVISFDGYTEAFRPGGIDLIGWIEAYSNLLTGLNRGDLDRANLLVPATPVIDEDQDGELADEIPIRDDATPRSFLNLSPPRYADGEARKDIYYNAIKEHLSNIPFKTFRRENIPYRDSTLPEIAGNLRIADSNPGQLIPELVASGVAVYHIGGLYDGFLPGTTKLYATMRAAGSQQLKLQIAPRFHYKPYLSPAYQKHFSYQGDYLKQLAAEKLRFFDYHLKGIKNGIHEEEPVHVYMANDGWRAESDWPPPDARSRSFYLRQGNTLGKEEEKDSASDVYRVRFDQQSSYGTNKVNRWLMMYLPDTIMDRTRHDELTTVYETAPLSEDTEVIGHPIANIFLSSDQPDGDLFVYLTEVTPEGQSLYVAEGQLRAGWHRLHPDDLQVDFRVDVRPNLPYHGFGSGSYDQAPFAGDKILSMRLALNPIAYRFRRGHRIRIAIAGADAGNFEMNPFLCKGNQPQDCPNTTWKIHRGSAFPSRIELPVLPRENSKKQ